MKNFFKFGCLGVIGIVVLLIVIGLVFGEDSADNTPITDPGAKETVSKDSNENNGKKDKDKPKTEKEETVSMGTALKIGDVEFTANEVSTTTEIKDAGGFISYKPESKGAVFLVVNVSVKNDGKEAITTDTSFFKLLDGDIEYSPTRIFTTDSTFFSFEGINPGLEKEGNILFEIPEGRKDLLLNVQTGFWGTEQGQIQLK